jgi:hypothetical protein
MPLLGFVLPFFGFLVVLVQNARVEDWKELAANGVLSLLGFVVTFKFIPRIKDKFTEAGLFGYDINKKGLAPGEKKM